MIRDTTPSDWLNQGNSPQIAQRAQILQRTTSGRLGDSFDFELDELEVEQQGGFQPGDIQIAEHLCHVILVERGDHLGVDDQPVVYDEVGDWTDPVRSTSAATVVRPDVTNCTWNDLT